MYDLDIAYNKKFFAQRKSLSWRVPIVVDAIMEVFNPKSVIDVGCGNGDLLTRFSERIKSPCYGIEGTANALPAVGIPMNNYVFIRDLRKPIRELLIRRADIAICFEVAEHLEPEYADIFVDNLCSFSDMIVMTAAPPGQGGRCHVNCQSYPYWFHKFTDRGYRARTDLVMQLQRKWEPWQHKKGIKAYYNNLMIWERIAK